MTYEATPRPRKVGWWQFLLGVAFLGAQALWFSKGLADQAQANMTAAIELKSALSQSSEALNRRIDIINDNLSRQSLALERISEHQSTRETETERRLQRLENLRDGEIKR